MIRVAFFLDLNKNWMGGINYYKNLFISIMNYSDKLKPVVFVPPNIDMSCLVDFPAELEVHKTSIMQRWRLAWLISRISKKIFHIDIFMTLLLYYYKIKIVSHDGTGEKYLGIKVFAWIPDFQHKYLKRFFTKEEIDRRDNVFTKLANHADKIILSSYTAKNDFQKFYPQHSSKAVVLQFVPEVDLDIVYNVNEISDKYKLPEKFFFLSNQYWLHKNHKIVLEALKILKDREIRDIVVVSTGNIHDYRFSSYFHELEEYIADNGLEKSYRVLGLIPYEDVQAIAEMSVAYINPSLFEGWSTTVEEAKYRGKKILLSNLKVHFEQAPDYGIYFSPDKANELADLMERIWNEPENKIDKSYLKNKLREKQKIFSRSFENICTE